MKNLTLILLFTLCSFSAAYGQNLVRIENSQGYYGYKDNGGFLIVPCKYKYAGKFSEGLAWVVENSDKLGFIDVNGKEVIPQMYESGDNFVEGLASVKLNGKWGYINTKGEMVIPFNYDLTTNFHENFARVKLNGKWGYINTKGEMVIAAQFKNAQEFKDGFALVTTTTNRDIYINKAGNIVKKKDMEEKPTSVVFGKEEYDNAFIALKKDNYKKANALFIESCNKGYDSACIELTKRGSDYQKAEYRKIAAEKGIPESMFLYGVFNIDEEEKANNSIFKPFATASIQEAYDYLIKAAKAGYEPAYLYLGKKAEEAGDITNAIRIYQNIADKGNGEVMYKVAILKKDPKTAFEIGERLADEPDYFRHDPYRAGDAIYESANKSKDLEYIMEVAKIFSKKEGGINAKELYKSRASTLYSNACELGNGEACYQNGLLNIEPYINRPYALRYYEKAISLGYKVPEEDLQFAKKTPTSRELESTREQDERDARYAKSHPNGDDGFVEERKPLTDPTKKPKSSLSQADMDKIIEANSPTKAQQDEAIRHQRAMDKIESEKMKIITGSKSGF